jgi:DNA-binding transcriptional ArsR family regulator
MINVANHFRFIYPRPKINLRNRTVALIFATERLLKWPFTFMRRDVFQAIADPTRRAILSLLALQAMTPNALADHFDSSRQAISKHIRILTECQLITQQQTGREIYYYFNSKKLKEVDKWLEQFRAMWDTRFTQLDTLLKTIKNKKS